MTEFQKIIKKTGATIIRSAPTILSGLGVAGFVATTIMAVRATPKALRILEDERELRQREANEQAAADYPDEMTFPHPEELTKAEIFRLVWKCYIPVAITGAATITCILGSNVLNRKQQASLASAFALVNRSYHDYKGEVKKRYGVEAHQEILKSLAVEKANDVPITATSMWSASSLEFEGAEEEELLFYDSYSCRYFQSTIGRVLQAEYHLNRNFSIGGGMISLNSFYEFLGITGIQGGDDIGWMLCDEYVWVDFDHCKMPMADGLVCYVIETPTEPAHFSTFDY